MRPSAGAISRVVESGPLLVVALAACAAVAALSLLWTNTPTYDPWSWIIWGRQIAHGTLVTTAGPSWKPLPVVFTTVYAFFGSAVAPSLWVITARAFAFAAVVFGVRVAWRAAGGLGGLVGGLLVVAAIFGSTHYLYTAEFAASEPMAIALAILAVDRHQVGRHRQALVCVWLVGLIRPEAWALLGAYGLWLLWHDRGSWKLLAGLVALLPLLWFVPEWIGSGDAFRASARAKIPNTTTYTWYPHPVRAVIKDARMEVPLAVMLGLVPAIAVAWVRRVRRPFDGLVVGAAGAAWVVLVVLMIARGYAGTFRYFMPGTALMAVGGGAGWGALQQTGWSLSRSRVVRAGFVLLSLAVLAATARGVHSRWPQIRADAQGVHRADVLRHQLPVAIARAGGRGPLLRCGRPATDKLQIPTVAWYLDIPSRDISAHPLAKPGYRGYIFQVAAGGHWSPAVPPGTQPFAQTRAWRVFAVGCPAV